MQQLRNASKKAPIDGHVPPLGVPSGTVIHCDNCLFEVDEDNFADDHYCCSRWHCFWTDEYLDSEQKQKPFDKRGRKTELETLQV